MKSQERNPEFVTNLPDLVEERMLLRARLPVLDELILKAVREERECGSSVANLAEILGVSKQRIYQMVDWFNNSRARLIEDEIDKYKAALEADPNFVISEGTTDSADE